MKRFKNVIVLLIMTGMVMSAAGCSITTQTAVETGETTEATYLVGSPGANENCEFVVTDINSFEITTDYGETMQYLLVGVSYTNLTDSVQDVSKRNVEFYLDNEEMFACEYREEFELFFDEGLMFNDKKVNPGRSKRGYIVYRIYRDYSIINICFDGVTVTADSDEVVPLILPSEEPEEAIIEEIYPTEPVPVETAPPPPPPEEVVEEPVEEVPEGEVPSE